MLILSRKAGELVKIEPHPDLDPATPIGTLFTKGPIEIIVARIDHVCVRLGIEAHPHFLILRNELYAKTS